jgi:predicted MFS family arabinose efflux permease
VTSVSFNILLSAVPLWVVNRVVPSASAGLPTTVMLLVTITLQPAVPWLLKRLRVGVVQAVGLVLLGGPALLYYLPARLPLILIISAARGVGFAIMTVVVTTLAANLVPAERHGESVALYGLVTAVPAVAGAPIGVALTRAGHFGVVAIVGSTPLLALPLAFLLGRAQSRSAPVAGDQKNTPAVLGRIWAPALFLFVGTVASGGLTAYLPIALREASVPLLLMGLGIVLGRWRVRGLVARFGTRRLVVACSLAAAAGVALVGAGARSGGPWVIIGAVIFGCSLGTIQSLSMILIFARAPAGFAATASVAWNISFDAGTGAGAGLVGGLSGLGIGIPAAFMVTGALIVASLPFTAGGSRQRQRHQRHQLVADVGGRDAGELGVIVAGRHLDDVGADEVQAGEAAQDGE